MTPQARARLVVVGGANGAGTTPVWVFGEAFWAHLNKQASSARDEDFA